MAEVTTGSMCDARDAEDRRLLESGEIDLLSGWIETIVGRCIATMRDADVGNDVAQVVCERLWRELKAGRHRDGAWPFRVIVHEVVDWTRAGSYEQRWDGLELVDGDGVAPGGFAEAVELQVTLETFVASLRPGDGEVARLPLLGRLEPAQLAERLRKEPNAVYQAGRST